MDETDLNNPAALRTALTARLRHELALGVETLSRVPLQVRERSAESPAPVLTPTPSTPPARPPAPMVDETPSAAPVQAPQTAALECSVEARWNELEARALACTKCVLHQGRNKVVFGEGSRSARLVFVGEGPGADEDASGRPFVGKAGQLLDKIIGAMGFKREDVYICNTVKCRPPGNRTPNPEELSACWPYLEAQLELLAPKAIVALGSPAAKTLLKTTQGIMGLRGRWQLYKGIRVMPTYHPAFVLRQYTETVRGEVWSDMQQVMNYLKEA